MQYARFRTLGLGALTVSALALSGCAAPPSNSADDGVLTIVASTSVYGNIAEQIAGGRADVVSIVSSAAQDPHSYEASAQDQLTISQADLIIENGGGYDPFIDTLIAGSGSTAVVINASEVSGLMESDGEDHADGEDHPDGEDHAHIEGFNEHVWYSFHAVEKIAEKIAEELGALDAANAAEYRVNYDAFAAEIAGLEAQATAIRETADGGVAAVTEPVAVYLLEEIGLANETPADFTEAIEEGADVSPSALQAVLTLIESGTVVVLAYNDQTESPETERVREAAEAAGVPVVSFLETLPEGSDYVSWQKANLETLAAALAA